VYIVIPNEFTFDQVVQLFNDFDPINETQVKKISDPRGGECYWVLNIWSHLVRSVIYFGLISRVRGQ